MKRKAAILFICFAALLLSGHRWGFFGHRLINRMAVFTLPPEMLGFYKHHIQYLTDNAVNPDARRYAVKDEGPRHFLDADVYGDSAVYKLPRYWNQAVAQYTEDTLMAYGIVPWHIQIMKSRLTRAFADRNVERILRLSAEIGHYIADANVPLHTTSNYNGQQTRQEGIHGFWETRLPELFSDEYDFFMDRAKYIENTQLEAWKAVINANIALDSVLDFERQLTLQMGEDKKYSFEEKNGRTIKVYSQPFSAAYHRMLSGQVERRMRASVQMVGDFWYTCWIDGGQPNLDLLLQYQFTDEELKEMEAQKKSWMQRLFLSRPHESGVE